VIRGYCVGNKYDSTEIGN